MNNEAAAHGEGVSIGDLKVINVVLSGRLYAEDL